jgi:hypothetical protein
MSKLFFVFILAAPSLCWANTVRTIVDRIDKEWNKLDVKVTPQLNTSQPVAGFGSLGLGVGYNYSVQPAYIQEQHQRIDGFAIRLSTAANPLISLGLSAEAQISFSRLFTTKIRAIKARPKPPTHFPFSSSEAILHLSPGTAARIEVASDGHIGSYFSQVLSQSTSAGAAALSASVRRGKRFLVDIYRVDNDRVRLRLISTRNMGSLGMSSSVTPLSALNFGMGFIDSILNKIFRCELISVSSETSISNVLPVDTIMLDYIVHLNTQMGRDAYDTFFQKILDMDILTQLSLFHNTQEFYQSVWFFAENLESLFLQEKVKPLTERSVQRSFKAQTLTDFRRIHVNSACFQLWGNSNETYHGTTSVRQYDEDNLAKDFFYLGTQNTSKNSFLFPFTKEEHTLGINTLFAAKREQDDNPLSLKPTELTDLVLLRTMKDRKMFKFEVRSYQKDIRYQYARLFPSIQWNPSPSVQDLAYSRIEVIFHPHALTVLRSQKYKEDALESLLTRYILGYAQQADPMMLSTSGGNPDLDKGTDLTRFKKDISLIARRLSLIFHPQVSVESVVKTFSTLRKNPLFQDIGAGFIVSLLPSNELAKSVDASFSFAAHATPTLEVSTKTTGTTALYKQLEHILSTINDRSFDLRLQKEITASATVEITKGPR